MTMIYQATAIMPDGSTKTVTGSVLECAKWVDSMPEAVRIDLVRIDEEEWTSDSIPVSSSASTAST